ncbi:MAG: C-GCAxxG-C-C family protein [Tissierellia bacterium]|nr:C-GCAxxG-C-C family protein [Tissierellia bacterium]
MTKKSLDQIEEQARTYFDKGELYCSEAVVKTINDALEQPMDPAIVKMASGFPVGLGMAQCLCGAVSGAEMALGLVYGREYGEEMDPSMFNYSKALHDYCVDEYGATCCRVITRKWKGDQFASKGRHEHCVEITGKMTRWVAEQLQKDGKL